MFSIPSWLQISPSDFVRAAQMGAEAGLGVARIQQASAEAAARRALESQQFNSTSGQRAQQHADDMALKQWEQSQQLQMHAQQLQAQRAKSAADLQARTAYNLANLGLRTRAQDSREEMAGQNLDFRQSQQERLQRNTDLAGQSLTLRREQEQRRLLNTLPPDKKAEVAMKMKDYGSILAQKQYETDPANLAKIDAALAAKHDEIMSAAGGAAAVPPPGKSLAVPSTIGGTHILPSDEGMVPPPESNLPDTPVQSLAPPAPTVQTPAGDSPFMPAPRTATDRKAGEIYMTPKGPHKWTENGWEPYQPTGQDDRSESDIPAPEAAPEETAVD